MKASITSEEVRLRDFIIFDIYEDSYSQNGPRVVNRMQALDGSVVSIDWGFSEFGRSINVQTTLSINDYEDLQGMKEDNNFSYLFHYKDTTFRVILSSVNGKYEGGKYNTNISMNSVKKLVFV